MAKHLYLVRHAKSDWSIPGQKDFDRDLNGRGTMDAPKMGKKLYDMGVKPDLVLSSPALRARLTLEYISEQLHFDTEKVIFEESIYEASVRNLMNIINELGDQYNEVMIFGHNPGFTYLAEFITKAEIGNIPTCGVVNIRLEIDSWKEVSGGNGHLEWFIYPKSDLE